LQGDLAIGAIEEKIVNAKTNGRVLAIEAVAGSMVATGTPLLCVGSQPKGAKGYEALVFLDVTQGPRAQTGMRAHLTPRSQRNRLSPSRAAHPMYSKTLIAGDHQLSSLTSTATRPFFPISTVKHTLSFSFISTVKPLA
jgi:hypothetical protein